MEAEILNKELFKLVDLIAARGGLNDDEAHAIRGVLQCHDYRIAQGRAQSENGKIMGVIKMAIGRGALNEEELAIWGEL